MTIYSLHSNRGKVQILATYQGSEGVTSSTVTSLPDAALAAPIVDALNRISALATVPVSIHDHRDRRHGYYPRRHLPALTDRNARTDLLQGAHSLWYEYVAVLLHQALTDLDDALSVVPAPVQTAIDAELETEARELRAALTEFEEGTQPESEEPRYWDFEFPFVPFDGGIGALSRETREFLDRHEEGISSKQREKTAADLRLLVTAYAQYQGGEAVLEAANLGIFDEPDGSDGYYLTVDAPKPTNDRNHAWRIQIGHWEPDDPEDEDCSSATGEPILSCICSTPPDASHIADLLNLNAKQPAQLAAWAKTPVGAALAGTAFVVTERHTA